MSAKTISTPLFILYVILLSSCNNSSHDHQGKTIDEYVISKDTCNLTDENGLRQGHWVPNYNNDLKDTLYYKDGKVVPK
jgi:hypothetical protein